VSPGLAAVRWLGRFCLEAKNVQLGELEQAATALGAMPAHPEEALAYLTELCQRHGVHISRAAGASGDGRFAGGAG
jgi:hypothetical protein